MPWIVAGCSAPTAPVFETTTDGGTWLVRLLEAPSGSGAQVLAVELEPADGRIASVVASMPDMGHASDAGIDDEGGGRFALDVDLAMAGWWVLDGSVTDGSIDEAFRLEIEVP